MSIYFKTELTTKILLQPPDINSMIDKVILDKIKQKYEGKCSRDGYVKHDSCNITNRSLGTFIQGQFNGNLQYKVNFTVDICNPAQNQEIECTVININKMGVLCIVGDDKNQPLKILLPRQNHIKNEEFPEIQLKNKVLIKVIGKRFELEDHFISVIGEFIQKV